MTTPDPQAHDLQAHLLYGEVEEDLRAGLRKLLEDRCPPGAVLRRLDDDRPHDLDLWRAVAADLGLAGLMVPEGAGGAGASAREAAVVLEELGRAVAPVPYLSSAVTATAALLAAAPDDPGLPRLAAGEEIAVLAVAFSDPPGGPFPERARVADGRLRGRLTGVADAEVAGLLLVPATSPHGPLLVAVPAGVAGMRVTPRTSLDTTRRLADVDLDLEWGAEVGGGPGGWAEPVRTLATGADAERAVARALSTAAGLLASEQLGMAQWCLDETVGYVKQRRQFGRPVGSFQALKHRLADVWLEVTQARAAARYAADALATGSPDTGVAVALAQAFCGQVAVHAAEECIQLHGGIGMTWEHPAHLYLKRAKSTEIALGSPGRHRADLARLVDLPPPG